MTDHSLEPAIYSDAGQVGEGPPWLHMYLREGDRGELRSNPGRPLCPGTPHLAGASGMENRCWGDRSDVLAPVATDLSPSSPSPLLLLWKRSASYSVSCSLLTAFRAYKDPGASGDKRLLSSPVPASAPPPRTNSQLRCSPGGSAPLSLSTSLTSNPLSCHCLLQGNNFFIRDFLTKLYITTIETVIHNTRSHTHL